LITLSAWEVSLHWGVWKYISCSRQGKHQHGAELAVEQGPPPQHRSSGSTGRVEQSRLSFGVLLVLLSVQCVLVRDRSPVWLLSPGGAVLGSVSRNRREESVACSSPTSAARRCPSVIIKCERCAPGSVSRA